MCYICDLRKNECLMSFLHIHTYLPPPHIFNANIGICLEKEMATHSSVLAWRIRGTGNLVGCRLWGRTELDTSDAT